MGLSRFPTGVDPDGAYPIDFPRRAYNFVYNEYYRDENLITEVALTNESILRRAWKKIILHQLYRGSREEQHRRSR